MSFCGSPVVVAKTDKTTARPPIAMYEGRSTRKAVYARVQGTHLFVSSIRSLRGAEVTIISRRFRPSRKYAKIMSSRYERRRERDSEPDERTQRSTSPGPPRKRSRPDVDPPSLRPAYQRPRSPSPKPHPSTPHYPAAANYHEPPQTPPPSVRSHQGDRYKPSPRLSQTSQGSFYAQTPTPADPKDSSNHPSTSAAPLKISSALATLSSSTALSSILSRTDGVEPPPRTTSSIPQSPSPASVSAPALGVSATQFDLAKLQSLSQALQNHGTISGAPTDGNTNPHTQKPAAVPTEPRPTHPMIIERSNSLLVRCKSSTSCDPSLIG